MNTFLNSEQEGLLKRYRLYVKESIAPLARDLDERKRSLKEVLQKLGREGYLAIHVLKKYGGQGAPFLNFCLFAEAVSEVEPGVAFSLAAHQAAIELLSSFGTDRQKSRYLPLLARGECVGSFAAAEETAGSDYTAVKTTIGRKGDKAVINGKKTWVVNGEIANLVLLTGRTGERQVGFKKNGGTEANDSQPASRLSIWLMDLDGQPSVEISPNRNKLGLRSASTNDLTFVDAEVPLDAFLGSVNPEDMSDDRQVDEQILKAMDVSKLVVAASAVGLLGRAIHESVERARTREQFGANIGKLQAIQWKLADMSAEASAATLMTYRAAWSKDHSPANLRKFAAMSKLYAARAARVHSSEAVQIFGALGLSDEQPLEKMYRDAKAMEIYEGTSEIQKNQIAADVGA